MDVGDEIVLNPSSFHYVKNVLRLKTGATVDLFNNMQSADFRANLEISSKQSVARIVSIEEFNNRSPIEIDLLLGLSRGDHLDWSIQKATELGVNNIHLFNADHSQIPIKPAQQEKKMAHWRAITVKACEQCRRHFIPELYVHKNLEALLRTQDQRSNNWLAHFAGKKFQAVINSGEVNSGRLLVGPEGGLSPNELQLAEQNQFQCVTFGPRVLRTETAVATALSIIQNHLGDI